MPDRFDPKVPPRAPSGTRPGLSKEDDPLAELAKIVQGRPTSSGSQPAKGRPGAPSADRAPSSSFSDLEAELLNDLQASFAAVNEAAANPPPPPPPPPVRAESRARPEPPPRPLPPPPEPPASSFELPPRQEPRQEARPDPQQDLPSARFVPIPPPPVMQPPPVHHTVTEPVAEKVPRAARPPAAAEVNADAEAEPNPFLLRPTLQPTPDQPQRQPRSRWEKPEPPKPHAAGASRFAPPQGARPPQPATAFEETDEEVDPFAEGGIFADTGDHDEAGELPPEGPDTVPGYGDDDDQFPPLDEFAPPAHPGRRRNLMLIGGVLALVIVGGAAFAVLRSGGEVATTPPVIVADSGPIKITPDDTTQTSTDADQQNKLIYDRLSANGNTNSDTTLVKPGDTQVAALPSAGGTQNPISRVIIPGGPGYDNPPGGNDTGTDQQTAAAPPPAANTTAGATTQAGAGDQTDTDAGEVIGPRKVRTVIVKPDGTIVSAAAVDAPPATAPAPTATTTATTTVAAAPPPVVAPAPGPVTDDTQAIAGTSDLPITPVPDPTGNNATLAGTKVPSLDTPPTTAPVTAPQPVTIIKPPAKTLPPKTVVATADQPIDLSANPPAATAGGGGMLVQMSSQRTEDAARATYRDLQARYPAILGKYAVNIQQADVPDRGTFFRVRVGPFSAADAQRLCDDLKSAGGDCLLAKQ